MQSENEIVKEYTEADGTRVRVRTVITRTFQSTGNGGGSSVQELEPATFTPAAQPAGKAKGIVSGASAEFKKQFLDAHNAYRAQHGAPALKYNDALNAQAQDWATHLAQIGQMVHRPNNKYGENISWRSSSAQLVLNGADSVKAWYDEVKNYHWFGQEPPGGSTFGTYGHFTQVVWKGSLELGVGLAVIDGKQCYVVGNYNPAGNYTGQYKNNVLAKK